VSIRDDVKTALRISASTTAYDGEVDDLITAAKADLQLAGVLADKVVDDDPLIKRAVVCYCKANFGWNNEDAERLTKSYDMLKAHLTLASDYTVEPEAVV
jgi:hypothetical protein